MQLKLNTKLRIEPEIAAAIGDSTAKDGHGQLSTELDIVSFHQERSCIFPTGLLYMNC